MGQILKNQEMQTAGAQKWIFRAILVLLPLVILILFESLLRLVNFGHDLSLFRESEIYKGYYEINPHVSKRFFTKFNGTSPSNDIFLVEKPDSSYRVFVMGCSTTAGFPYEANVAFPRILYYRLQDAFPNRKIEVVNTAMSAVNSYTQADFIDEILDQKPDAILIYTGHNEYYGALGVGSVESVGNVKWMKRLHLKLIRLRTYQLVQRTLAGVLKLIANDNTRPTGTLMERIVKDKSIAFNSETYLAGLEQFKSNMDIVLKKANKKNIPVVFSNLVSNVHGLKPFNSIESTEIPAANDVFAHAREAEKNGEFDKARELYYRAKDLDGIRFRASEDLNNVISDLAKTNKANFLDIQDIFEKASENGLIGDKLMIEHLHPNVDGYFLMADAFFNEMRNLRLIDEQWDSTLIKSVDFYRKNWGFTELDSLSADLGIRTLKAGWPFQPEDVVNTFIYDYKPVSFIDSIAAMTVKYDNVTVASQHKNLANYYAKNGQFDKAFAEYHSLVKTSPYVVQYYIDGLQYLQKLNNPKGEIEFLKSYPDYQNNFYLCMNIGKAYEKLNLNKEALTSFLQAKKIFNKENDSEEYLLTSLLSVYRTNQDFENANAILARIKQINPSFNENSTNKEAVVILVEKDVKDLILKAISSARSEKFGEALNLLEESLKIKETALAYQIMGSIYFQQKDDRAMKYFENSYRLDPTNENTLNNLFVLSLMKKNYQAGKRYLEEFKLITKDYVRAKKLSLMYEEALSKK